MKKEIVMIAAAVMLLFGACGVVPDYSTQVSNTQSPGGTPQVTEGNESIEAAIEGEQIVTGVNEAEEEQEPSRGEAVVIGSLEVSINNTRNSDAYFYVKLVPDFKLNEEFVYDGKIYYEWWNVPEMEAYNEEYEIWLVEVYPGLDEEMRAAQERGEPQAQGWDNHNPQDYFDIYYQHTQEEQVLTAWEAARDKAIAAEQAYEEWTATQEYLENEYSLMKEETERLNEEGYLVELSGWDLNGYLTKEQIEEFDCGEYGYNILWADDQSESE